MIIVNVEIKSSTIKKKNNSLKKITKYLAQLRFVFNQNAKSSLFFISSYCSVTIYQNFTETLAFVAIRKQISSQISSTFISFVKAIYLFMRRKMMFNDCSQQVYVSVAQC